MNTIHKKYLSKVIKGVFIWITIMASVLIFMTLVATIKRDSSLGERIWNNTSDSLYIWGDDSDSPLVHNTKWFQIGNGDDMILANMAITDTPEDPLSKAMAINRYINEADRSDMNDIITALYYSDSGIYVNYSRFYMLTNSIMKLLLIFFDAAQIHLLLYYVIMSLFIAILCNLHKYVGWRGSISFTVACLSRLLLWHSVSFNAFSDIFIGFIGMLFVISFHKKSWYRENEIFLFGVIGMYAYISCMFYAPLFTLGMPLVTTILLSNNSDKKLSSWLRILLNSIAWLFGFASAIFAKMIICKLLFGSQTASGEMKYMLGLDMSMSERIDMIKWVVNGALEPYGVKLPLLAIVIICFVIAIIKNGFNRYSSAFQLLTLALYPFVWIMIVCRHSLHNLVANIMCISVFALFALLAMLSKENTTEKTG